MVHTRFERLFFNLGYLAIIGLMVVILTVTFWLAYPYNVMEFKEGNGTFITNTVHGGEYLEMKQVYCKRGNYTSYINRQFVDGIIYQVSQTEAKRPTGCHESVEYIYVPKALPVGIYKIRTVISFKVNPVRTISYIVETSDFEIIK